MEKLKTKRGFWKWLLLTIITFGIYEFYMIYKMSKEVNLTCKDCGKDVGGLGFYLLFSLLTLGFYSLYWHYRICEKMSDLMKKHGRVPRITGGGYLLWVIFGTLIIVGPLVAFIKEIHSWNDTNEIYNQINGLN